jgi:hypothetical protein
MTKTPLLTRAALAALNGILAVVRRDDASDDGWQL